MRLAWQILGTEGPAALVNRLLDRVAAHRRRRSFRRLAAGEALRQVDVLNVLPTAPRPDWGGVQTQLLRRLDAEGKLRPWALLFPDADGADGTYRLEVYGGDVRVAVSLPASGIARAIHVAAERLGAGIVHVEQSLGLAFTELVRVAEADLKLVLSVHDFGLFCRRPHLIERPGLRFCHFSRDPERCHRCLAQDWDLPSDAQSSWRADAQALLAAASAAVYPSDFLRRTYAELFELDPQRQHVVAPPVVARPVEPPPPRPSHHAGTGAVKHLAYVGSVQPHKGARVLIDLIESMQAGGEHDLRWTVYGGGAPELLRGLRKLPGVRVRGYYRSGSLPELLRRDEVDLALLLSIWPETYALTLDECRLAGVPVLAFDHGAPADRIRAWGAGWTVPPLKGFDAGVEALAESVSARLRGEMELPEQHPVRIADARSAAEKISEIYRGLAE